MRHISDDPIPAQIMAFPLTGVDNSVGKLMNEFPGRHV